MWGLSYSTGCAWGTPPNFVTCAAVNGIGSGFSYTLSTGGNPSLPFTASSVAYMAPTVASVNMTGGRLSTAGGTSL